MTVPLAEPNDVADRFPDLTINTVQVEKLIDDASAIVRAYAGRTWLNDDGDALEGVPAGVPGIVASMVARALANPAGVTQETAGPFNVSYGSSAADRLFLTKAEKALLRGGAQRAFTINPAPDPDDVEPSYLGGYAAADTWH